MKGFPYCLTIEPTNLCNLECPECPTGINGLSRPAGKMNLTFFENIINETSPFALYLMFYFQGEPYIHADFFKMIRYAKQKRFYVCTSTNGHFLSQENARQTVESGLDKIIISLDGATQEVYGEYRRNGQLDIVIEGIENLVKAKKELKSKTPYIEIQCLVFSYNESQIYTVQQLARELKANRFRLKSSQFNDFENKEELLSTNQKYNRYKKNKEGILILKKKLKNRCARLWSTAVITWEGSVVPCCYDKKAIYCMGSITNSSLKEIWMSKEFKMFRTKILGNRKSIPICNNCI